MVIAFFAFNERNERSRGRDVQIQCNSIWGKLQKTVYNYQRFCCWWNLPFRLSWPKRWWKFERLELYIERERENGVITRQYKTCKVSLLNDRHHRQMKPKISVCLYEFDGGALGAAYRWWDWRNRWRQIHRRQHPNESLKWRRRKSVDSFPFRVDEHWSKCLVISDFECKINRIHLSHVHCFEPIRLDVVVTKALNTVWPMLIVRENLPRIRNKTHAKDRGIYI